VLLNSEKQITLFQETYSLVECVHRFAEVNCVSRRPVRPLAKHAVISLKRNMVYTAYMERAIFKELEIRRLEIQTAWLV